MQTRQGSDPLQSKTWQLDNTTIGTEGHLYYCLLCDEALVLSRSTFNSKRVSIAFNNTCPGCGFGLDRVLSCKPSILPAGGRLLTSLKCTNTNVLVEQTIQVYDPAQRASSLLRDSETITTGIEAIDRTLPLRRGQLVFLQGEKSHALSLLYLMRTTLSASESVKSVIFLDAGNLFDTTATPQLGLSLGLENWQSHERVHLSRAFTHHQVYNLIMDKLPSDIDSYHPVLAVVCDMPALFCDPDVHDKRESIEMFRESTRFLATIAGSRQILILVTSIKPRNRTMEDTLARTAHVTAHLKETRHHTLLKVTLHPFLEEGRGQAVLDKDSLTGHL